MPITVVNAARVKELLPMAACIPLMRRAHAMVANQEAIMPVRQGVRAPGVPGLLGVMPGYSASPPWYAAKIVSVFPGNFGTAFDAHQGMVLLFDTETGAPKGIVDASAITAIRTAASTAVATDVLAAKDARSLGIMGYGEQARRHIEALILVRDFTEIAVWGRDAGKCAAFCGEMSDLSGRSVQAVEAPEVAAQADVVCTATAAGKPFYAASWLRNGQHLNLIGASMPGEAEADPAVVAGARCYYDSREGALALAGDFLGALKAGAISEDDLIGSVGDVITGRVEGRTTADDITLFKSLGLIVQDILAADFVLQAAAAKPDHCVLEW